MKLNPKMIAGVLRALMALLAPQIEPTDEMVERGAEAVVVVGVIAWSLYEKWRDSKKDEKK